MVLTHLLKPKPEKRLPKGINSINKKTCVMKRDLLSLVIKEGADFHQTQANIDKCRSQLKSCIKNDRVTTLCLSAESKFLHYNEP